MLARESKSHHVRCPRRGDEGEALGRRAGLLAFASTEVRAGPGAEAVLLARWSAARRGEQKQYGTGDSQEITQPSTNPAQAGLSCEF